MEDSVKYIRMTVMEPYPGMKDKMKTFKRNSDDNATQVRLLNQNLARP